MNPQIGTPNPHGATCPDCGAVLVLARTRPELIYRCPAFVARRDAPRASEVDFFRDRRFAYIPAGDKHRACYSWTDAELRSMVAA